VNRLHGENLHDCGRREPLSADHRFERGAEIAIVLLGIIYELRSVRKPGQHFEGFYQVAARKRNRYVQHTRSSTIILLDLELPALWPQSKEVCCGSERIGMIWLGDGIDASKAGKSSEAGGSVSPL